MLFADLAATSLAVGATRSRKRKAELLGEALRALEPGEVEPARRLPERRAAPAAHGRRVGVVAGSARRRRPSRRCKLVRSISRWSSIAELSGAGSQAARRDAIADLFARATADEQAFLRGLISGEVRQGALAGVMADAVAVATGIPRATVDRATMLRGDARVVAEAALREGEEGLQRFRLEVGRPVKPMLASPSASLDEAMEKVGEGVVDWKLDGARIQVHRDGDDVAISSRSLDDLTARLPEVVAAVRALPARRRGARRRGDRAARTTAGRSRSR